MLDKLDPTPETSAESQGRYMRLLGREEFSRLMGACIEGVLERHGNLPPGEARRLRWRTLRSFTSLLAARTKRVRTLTKSECMAELERTHGSLVRERAKRVEELDGLAQELHEARAHAPEPVLTSAEESALELALGADIEALIKSSNPRQGLAQVLLREGQRRRAALAGVVSRERERIDQLERRIAKLRAAQKQMEAALAELARRAEIDGGLPSIYRTVQGLEAGESARETKSAMLAEIFQQNLVLQHKAPAQAEILPVAPKPPAPAEPARDAALLQQKSA